MLIKLKQPLLSSVKYQLLETQSWWQLIQKWVTSIKCNHEGGRRRTDRGFQRADSVRAGKAHWSEYGDAFLRGQVVADRGGTHGAVTGGGPRVHHGGQNEWFCEVWGKIKRKQNQVRFLTNVVKGLKHLPHVKIHHRGWFWSACKKQD